MTLPNAIKIFGENAITKMTTVTASSGDGTKQNLYDQRPATVWLSSGSNDTVTEQLEFEFYSKIGYAAPAYFDRVIFLNHNIKSMSVELIYNNVTSSISELTIADNAASNLIVELAAPVYADLLKIYPATTIAANEEKSIGEIKLCKYLMELNVLSEFQRADWRKGGDYRTRDGSLVRWNEAQRVEGAFTLENVSQTQRDALYQATLDYDFLTFVLYDDYDPAAVYEFAVINAPSETFDRKTQLYTITLNVKER